MEAAVLTAPKGRPREFDVDEALAAALRVFWRSGYDGASLTDLTEAMGITRPSLYAAFGNKEALFRKALDLYEREKLAYMGTALSAPTARGVAERLLRGAVDITSGTCDPRGCLGVISTVACSEGAQSIRADVLARRASSEAAMARRFAEAQDAGDLPAATDPQALVRYVVALMQGIAVQAGAGATRAELDALVEQALQIWPGR